MITLICPWKPMGVPGRMKATRGTVPAGVSGGSEGGHGGDDREDGLEGWRCHYDSRLGFYQVSRNAAVKW